MFTFHKPKVFRSTNGCCICKAKSSSSRFTDSGKYEAVFVRCFSLEQMRSGEICNACVLLVKRFLKLPKDSKKNWNHVVDARSGPGIKSMVKNKNKLNKMKSDLEENNANSSLDSVSLIDSPDKIKKKHVYKPKKAKRKMEKSTIRQRDPSEQFSDFLDDTLWRREDICCGSIFIGPFGEVALDMKYYKPCNGCNKNKPATVVEKTPKGESMDCGDGFAHLEASNKLSAVCAAAEAAEAAASSSSTGLDEESNGISISMSGDFDEGFFDKPTISPSSEGSATPPPSEATLEEEEDDEESLPGLNLENRSQLSTLRTPLLASN